MRTAPETAARVAPCIGRRALPRRQVGVGVRGATEPPTYSSWLNQVENWFSRIQRDIIARGIFTSIKDLDKKLMRYIRQYNKNPRPLKWKYADPTRRVTADSCDSVD